MSSGNKSKREMKDKLVKLKRNLRILDQEIKRREELYDPVNYGFPDLNGLEKRGDETEKEFKERQNQKLKEAVEDNLYIHKDGEKNTVKINGPYLKACSDLFYGRTKKAILWGPRGGGKSVIASVLIYLKMIYDQMSFTNIANSQEQAKVVYDYVKNFWTCKQDLANNLLVKPPLKKETVLRGNVSLKCVTASQKQTRGKHPPGLIIDEAASDDENVEEVFRAMMQGPLSEPNHCIFIMSTFHIPQGFFQEIWDKADEKGFKKYKADIFSSMSQCTKGLEHATEDDPLAKENYCMTDCPLTEKEDVLDYKGKKVDERIIGCQGKARHTDGHMEFDQVKSLKDQNKGTDKYYVEILCQRPGQKRLVFRPKFLDGEKASIIDLESWMKENNIEIKPETRKIVGLDWGYDDELAMVLAHRIENNVIVTDLAMESNVIIDFVVNKIEEWKEEYGGMIPIYADASDKMQNAELAQKHNIPTASIHFGKYKNNMVSNLNKYFVKQRIKISKELSRLSNQLKKYRRDSRGKIKKGDDHSVDALMLAIFRFYYSNEFPNDNVDEQKIIKENMNEDHGVENEEDDINVSTF